MNLLDFKYWISLNESQKSYYVFEIPKRRLTELDEEYLKGLQELLANLPDSMYDLEYSQGSIALTLTASQDELISSIYGESKDITIYLTSPGSSTYLAGSFKTISSSQLVDCLKRANYSNKIKETKDVTTIQFSIQSSELDAVMARATQCATPTKESAKIDTASLLELIYDSSNMGDSKIKEFTDSLNYYLRTFAVQSALKRYMTSESTPNLEEVEASIRERLANIKSIDIDSISPEEKETLLSTVIEFQRDLLSKSSPKDIEKNLTTDALITNFRILLKEVGGVKEIKRAIG
jgi:hypothetical protein